MQIGTYPNYFLGPVKLKLDTNALVFHGLPRWGPTKRIALGFALATAFTFLQYLLNYLLAATHLNDVAATILNGITSLTFLYLIAGRQVERLLRRSSRTPPPITLPARALAMRGPRPNDASKNEAR